MVESKASESHLKSLNSKVINNELSHQPLQELWWCTRGVDRLDEGWTNEGLVPGEATISQFSIMSVWESRKVCSGASNSSSRWLFFFHISEDQQQQVFVAQVLRDQSQSLLDVGLSLCICSGACRWHPRAQTRPAVLVQSQELIPVCRFWIRPCRTQVSLLHVRSSVTVWWHLWPKALH